MLRKTVVEGERSTRAKLNGVNPNPRLGVIWPCVGKKIQELTDEL